MTQTPRAQMEAACLPDQILQLYKDSEKIYSTPDGPAEMAVLRLQCGAILGRIHALQKKIEKLQEDLADGNFNELQRGSIKVTQSMLSQYAVMLKTKEAAAKDMAESLASAERTVRYSSTQKAVSEMAERTVRNG